MTLDRLKELLAYAPSTGAFTRLTRSSTAKIGDVAGSKHNAGYRQISVGGASYLAHRLAWFYVHGEWPTGQIDHINGDRADNRIANLRDVSVQTNRENQKTPRSDNRLGVMGVTYHRRSRTYRATITSGGEVTALGYFKTAAEAGDAYQEAKKRMHAGYVP